MRLDGEAYFDVVLNARIPFVVHTRNVRTDVLGTTFTVRRYERDVSTRVAVTTGRVSVAAFTDTNRSARHPTVVLSAGMVGDVTDSSAVALAASDLSEYTGWRTGSLEFYRTPIRDVLASIERWYGYQFRLADSAVLQRDLTATFDPRNATDMLRTLDALLDAILTVDGTVVTIRSRQPLNVRAQ